MLKRLRPVVLAVMLVAAAGSAAFGKQTGKGSGEAATQIRAVLNSTAEGWNRGDLSQYLSAYTESATEMGPNGPEGGVDAIERTMRRGFWKTGRPLQQLRYEHVEVRMLGKEHALVTGQFVLTGGERPDRTGWFTTVWTRTRQGWRMIHDHS